MLTWERISRCLRVLEVLALFVGVIVAVLALTVYRQQATISAVNRLDEADDGLTQMQLEKPYLASIYVDLKNGLAPKDEADLYLAMLAGCSSEPHHPCAPANGPLPTWRTIPELDCALWSGPDISGTKSKLREGSLHAEAILYLVARAHERRIEIGPREYAIWAAYVRNVGHHPLFLSAFHYGRLHGYMTEESSNEIVRLLKSSSRAKAMAEAIYPDYDSFRPATMEGKKSCP